MSSVPRILSMIRMLLRVLVRFQRGEGKEERTVELSSLTTKVTLQDGHFLIFYSYDGSNLVRRLPRRSTLQLHHPNCRGDSSEGQSPRDPQAGEEDRRWRAGRESSSEREYISRLTHQKR